MKKSSLGKLVTIILFLLISNTSHGSELKALSKSACQDPYSIINKATILQLPDRYLTFRIFETGGGDPAMNGNKIILNISEWDLSGNSYTWDTGINISKLNLIDLKDDKIIIKCTEHLIEKDTGKIQTVPGTYSISYFIDKAEQHLMDTIKIED